MLDKLKISLCVKTDLSNMLYFNSYVHANILQSDLTYLHTSVLDEMADKVRELV